MAEYDVFVSYSRADRAWVRGELLPRLEGAGLTVCIDYRDFAVGAPIVTEMERAVVESTKTLLVLTPAYLGSAWTEFETLMLQVLDPGARERRLIPVLKEACALPVRIGYLGYVDLTDPAERALGWARLLGALGAAADGASAPPPGARREPAASPVPAARLIPAIDPDHPPIRQVRKLLTDAFGAEELRRFCQDRPVLRPVVAQFGPGQGLAEMVDEVIEYVQARLLWTELLAAVAEENERQYERFLAAL
ncbi:MAG: toll/interleukin-1 receptor domain-containing protein [Anaerolineae bacterium]|nr:toll/interleukin-1 receptor domain-containing protein [Anaerolineae bacterium]